MALNINPDIEAQLVALGAQDRYRMAETPWRRAAAKDVKPITILIRD